LNESKKEKESGVGGLGFDWAILAFHAKWPNQTPTGVSFLLLLFSSFFWVTVCDLGIGFQKELCVAGRCGMHGPLMPII
jgi:hypothetical protein